ncbi:guanylate kinase [Condylostylus longicornis]|uniref:guanylate kinase n=1 Tax=Condylostylus longicornis TaxID=2530218 RepID=UPI00244E277F|nr:guanylate kinase [Condylostylus longicornis]
MLTLMALIARAFSSMSNEGPRPLVICGPSGSGKSTLLKKLFEEFPDTFGFSISHTTRNPRPGEQHGIHYHFVTRQEMHDSISNGEFIETACFSGNLYGTSIQAVRTVQSQGKVCVLDIEIQGVEQIRNSNLNPILIFNNPPSIEELERRLRGRNTETEESLQKRLDTARREIEYGRTPGNFHTIIHNDDIERAYRELKKFILQELEEQQRNGIALNLRQINSSEIN